MLPLVVDADTALGSPFGDIDDGFAIAALALSANPPIALSSVFGNTFEPWASRNNAELAKVLRFEGKLLRGAATHWARGSETARYLASEAPRCRLLALGPLTNVALALRQKPTLADTVQELIFTGTNYSARLPALRFFDFNFSKDRKSARAVLTSPLALTCVPCDVARKLRFSEQELLRWRGTAGEYVRKHARRWFLRARWLKRAGTVPIWDLVAALYAIAPEFFTVEDTVIAAESSWGPRYRVGQKAIRVVTGFDSALLKEKFFSLLP